MRLSTLLAIATAGTATVMFLFHVRSTMHESINEIQKRFSQRRPIVVVGASAAGTSAITELMQQAEQPVVWIAAQREEPYNRTKIRHILGGRATAEQIALPPLSETTSSLIKLFGTRVRAINAQNHSVTLQDGATIPYHKLLLCIGTEQKKPRELDLPGAVGIFPYNQQEHAIQLRNFIRQETPASALVVGAGINGLELADELARHGIPVHLVDRNPYPLFHMVDHASGTFIAQHIQKAGWHFYPNNQVSSVKIAQGRVVGVTLSKGEEIEIDIIAYSVGGSVDASLVKSAGIEMRQHRIVVDQHLRTNVPDIFAAGDAILIPHLPTQIMTPSRKWKDACVQGRVAARVMLGHTDRYEGSTVMQRTTIAGLQIITAGNVLNRQPDWQIIIQTRGAGQLTMILDPKTKILKGFVLVTATNEDAGIARLEKNLHDATPIEITSHPL